MFINKFMFSVPFNVRALVVLIALILPVQFVSAQQEKAEGDIRQVQEEVYAKQQDPTRPPSVIVQQLSEELEIKPEFELTAIFSRNKQQYAVVNGTVLKTGDALDDMVVTEISDTNITLQNTQSDQLAKVIELHAGLNIKKQVLK